MKKTTFSSQNFRKLLKEIAETKTWEKLEEFHSCKALELMSLNDKSKLADLFYQKGKHLSLDQKNESVLKEALRSFETALMIDPAIGQAWLEKAEVLMSLATLLEDPTFFNDAFEMFLNAEKVFASQGKLMPVEYLYRWGTCSYQLGKYSEEPLDFKIAVEKFREAFERGSDSPEFFFDYATALAELGGAIGRVEFILESLDYFQRSLKVESDNPKIWLKFACVSKLLYLITQEPEYYTLADQSFFEAARNSYSNFVLWLNWGQLLAYEGKITRDLELLNASLEKFEKADALNANDPIILSSWADALMHAGALEERLDFLREAQEKIETCLVLCPNDVDLICLHGHCLIHLGRYFADERFLNEATQKFHEGLALDKKISILWHGLATAHYLLGEICQDRVHFERASKCCSEAIELGEEENAQYWNDWGVALMKLAEMGHNLRLMLEASEKFEKAIALYNKKKPSLPEPEWFYNYACTLDYLGDFYGNPNYYEKAINIFIKILDQYPHLNHVRYSLALSLYHLGDATCDVEYLENAIEHFEILLMHDQEDEILCNDFGVTYLTLADLLVDTILPNRSEEPFEKAEQLFVQAIAGGSLIAYYHLACLHSLKGNYPEAMFFIEKAKLVKVLPAIDDLLQDEWLEGLRQTSSFHSFLNTLSSSPEE